MEERLAQLRPRGPRSGLRERVIAAADRERDARSRIDALWRSRAFWSAAAAAIVLGLVLGSGGQPRVPSATPRPPSTDSVETAETLAAMLGRDGTLASSLAKRLSAAPPARDGEDARRLMEDMTWRG